MYFVVSNIPMRAAMRLNQQEARQELMNTSTSRHLSLRSFPLSRTPRSRKHRRARGSYRRDTWPRGRRRIVGGSPALSKCALSGGGGGKGWVGTARES